MSDTSFVFSSLHVAGLILCLCVHVPTFYRKNRVSSATGELYSDEDGESTQETHSAFFRRSRNQIQAHLAMSFVGLVINCAAALLRFRKESNFSERSRLFEVFVWILTSLLLASHSLVIAHTSSSHDRQTQGALSGCGSLFIYSVNVWYDLQELPEPRTRLTFSILHLLLLLVSVMVNFTIPRRPLVFRGGAPSRPVDSEKTVSLLSRLTLSWANTKLRYAVRRGGLDFQDLPYLKARMSTRALISSIKEVTSDRKLWRSIILAHRSTFGWQWLLTTLRSFASLAPQYFMYRLILILEIDPIHADRKAVMWLALLGLAQLAYPWIEAWSLWLGWCHVALPVNMELSGLIVEKSMRKKDTKGIKSKDQEVKGKESENADGRGDFQEHHASRDARQEPSSVDTLDEINLMSVDVERVSDFLSYNGMFLGLATSIAISLWFLLSIIRVQSILIGLGGVSVFIPLNMVAKKRYSKAQNDLMSAHDMKTATVSEALRGIRQVKFDALEPAWFKRIRAVRDMELSKQWNAYLAQALLVLCWIAGPTFFSAITLSTVALHQGGISPAVAFTSLAIFQRLESTLGLVPELLTDFVNARVSLGRIEAFLHSPERIDETSNADNITFDDVSIAWPSDETSSRSFMLHNLNFAFPKYELSLIVGPTGSGKSLLLQAIIGEAEIFSGAVRRPHPNLNCPTQSVNLDGKDWILPGHTAFVAQTAWIENDSLRANILFGLPFCPTRYATVLDACALSPDIATMEKGDLTEIGSHGVNLSGGQRARLTLARALYSRAEIIVMDDVFSAVDSHVGQHLLDHALTGGFMENRTCILATHHLHLCRSTANFVVMLDGGTAKYTGPPSGLEGCLEIAGHQSRSTEGSSSESKSSPPTLIDEDDDENNDNEVERTPAGKDQSSGTPASEGHGFLEDIPEQWAEKESRQKGRIKSSVYKQYLRAASSWPWTYWLLVFVFLAGFESTLVVRSWWVKTWSEYDHHPTAKAVGPPSRLSEFQHAYGYNLQAFVAPSMTSSHTHSERNNFFIIGYFSIALLVSLLGTIKFFWVYLGSIRASRSLFSTMTTAVLHAPLQWLDEVPTGRILNRFVADFNTIDSSLANNLVLLAHSALQLLGITVVGAFVSPYILLCAIPLVGTCVFYAKMYLAGARDVKRLEAIKKSPIFDTLSSILAGLSTIRVSGKTQHYVELMQSHIDAHGRCVWHLWLFNRWLGIRFALLGALFTTVVATFAVYSPSVSASLAGLALSFSLDFTDAVFWVLRRYADVEMDMNSLERVSEFCAIPNEPTAGDIPPEEWPPEGMIEVQDLSVAYSPEGKPALNGISFTVPAGERMGIVGRTGAGKSSLTLALFRFLEARTGKILIDGVDISKISLPSLRSQIGIIPQHPVLWLGTVRSNLDPWDIYTDEELLHVLRRVYLITSPSPSPLPPPPISSSPSSSAPSPSPDSQHSNQLTLSTPLAPSATNLSLGQRQLLCLARQLLVSPRILILDEATSAVDPATDQKIQKVIREEFKGCTLLAIAHRMSTVRDFDGVVVIEAGKVKCVGKPEEVLGRGE